MSKLFTAIGNDNIQETTRVLPRNIQAEQSILGALLINNESITRVSDYLMAEHFFEPVHQRIYTAIGKFFDRGVIATPVTLKNYFENDEALQDIGGAQYLVRLSNLATSIINLETYGRTVYDLSLKRLLISIGEDIVNDAFEPNLDKSSKEQIEVAEQRLFNLASSGIKENDFNHIAHALGEAMKTADLAYKSDKKLIGIDTGFTDFNKIIGGFQKSDLIILAGRPSMGKTAVSLNMALNSCNLMLQEYQKSGGEDIPPPSVGFFSLEMSGEQLASRLIAMESSVPADKVRSGNITEDDFKKLVKGNSALNKLPFYIDDTPALTISALRTRVRRMKRKHNLSLLFIDYLQLLRGSSRASDSSRVNEVSEITQGLKAIAKELNIPVIALSQLSRAVEQREDKRPQLSDLRESGSIEQDADIVIFIYRDEYYLSRKEPVGNSDTKAIQDWNHQMERSKNLTELIVAKNRNGNIGKAYLTFVPELTKFRDHTENHDPKSSVID